MKAHYFLLAIATALTGCSPDDGPKIRMALAQCELEYPIGPAPPGDPTLSDPGTLRFLKWAQGEKINTCMQAKGFTHTGEFLALGGAKKTKCDYQITDKYDSEYTDADCYRLDR